MSYLAVFLLLPLSAFAENSDYQTVQNFKTAQEAIQDEIQTASKAEELEQIQKKIDQLQLQYRPHEAILNEALYPVSFSNAISELKLKWSEKVEKHELTDELAKTVSEKEQLSDNLKISNEERDKLSSDLKVAQNSVKRLEAQLKKNKAKLLRISSDNKQLTQKIQTLRAEMKKDKETIERINQLVEQLSTNIRSRDNLITSMVNNLFKDFNNPEISEEEKRNLIITINKNDFFETILSPIRENLNFLKTPNLSAEDLMFSQKEYERFSTLWTQLDHKLTSAYGKDMEKKNTLASVKASIQDWDIQLESATWENLHALFSDNGISVPTFINGSEFHDKILAWIDGQIANQSYELWDPFVNEIWKPIVKKEWIPYLLAEHRLTEEQVFDIETKIHEWKKDYTAVFWGIGILVLLAGIGALFFIMKRK